ncbi:MAG: hypothetical protein K2P84_04150 [Undibacterium sp.]|nr:hypothetical protein [Undibacterium sp.]
MMRNRFAFYAFFPLVAFSTVLIPISWLVKLVLISVGMFPISLILGIALIPVFAAGVALCSVGMISLWISLRWQKKMVRLMSLLPMIFVPICIYLGHSFAHYLSQKEGDHLFTQFDVLSLQAYFLYPFLTFILAILSWTGRSLPSGEPAITKDTLGKILGMWCVIFLFWAISVFTLLITQSSVRQYLAQLRIDHADVIEVDGVKHPIVEAICAGQLARADQLIDDRANALDMGSVSYVISTCLKKRIGDLQKHTPPRFYVERVPVTLKAILAYERAQSGAAQNGCTPLRSLLLKPIFQDNINEQGLLAFTRLGLPINCQEKMNDGTSYPLWWSIAFVDNDGQPYRVSYDHLIRLEKHDISLLETDSTGQQFLSANWNDFQKKIEDRALLYLVERGLETGVTRPGRHALSIELMLRRFGYRDSEVGSAEFKKLLVSIGEPSLQQLLVIKEGKLFFFPERKESDARSVAMYDYMNQRIAQLSKK